MPNPNYAVSTELDAVNQILSSVGQAPVTTLDMQNPEVYTTLQTLREVSRNLQAEGWVFNTERRVKFVPRADKTIALEFDILQIDASRDMHRDTYNLIQKKRLLYDKYNHTNEFTEDIYCDVVYYYDFNDLPYAFQAHIQAKAARQIALKLVGDQELVRLLSIDEELTKQAMMEYETQQGDYSMFGWKDGYNTYSSYKPFQALAR